MIITVKRRWFTPQSAIGELWINGALFCYTLEDTVRDPNAPKVPGRTAIPPGNYKLIIDHSPRFGRQMPHILDVPGFVGIRIHAGNDPTDTEGCLLLGMERGIDRVLRSREAFRAFMSILQESGGQAMIDIS